MGFRPPAKEEAASPQEVVKAYADSLRSGMYAGDIESTLLHQLHGVVVRIFTANGPDVIHTRSFDSIPNWAARPDFYRQCYPPDCINLLYNGYNHYDSLVKRKPATAAAPAPSEVDPNIAEAESLGMNLNNYKAAKKFAQGQEKAQNVSSDPNYEDAKSMGMSLNNYKAAKRLAETQEKSRSNLPMNSASVYSRKLAAIVDTITRQAMEQNITKQRIVLSAVKKFEERVKAALVRPLSSGFFAKLDAELQKSTFPQFEMELGLDSGSLYKVWSSSAGGRRKTRGRRGTRRRGSRKA
jgi:hypothetical protein